MEHSAGSKLTIATSFTLIELLVVVAIIAVLIAILLPSLIAVRSEGHRITCLANMRTLGHAVYYYLEEYDGYFPYPRHGPTKWFNALNWYVKNQKSFLCPSRKGKGPSAPSDYPDWKINIGFNHFFLYDYRQPPFNTSFNFWLRSVRYIKHPEATMLIADGAYWLLEADWYPSSGTNRTDGRRHAHGEGGYGLNQLFADQHAETSFDLIPARWTPKGYAYWWGMDYEFLPEP